MSDPSGIYRGSIGNELLLKTREDQGLLILEERESIGGSDEGRLTGVWPGELTGTWQAPGAKSGKNFTLQRTSHRTETAQGDADYPEGITEETAPYTRACLLAKLQPQVVKAETLIAPGLAYQLVRETIAAAPIHG